MSEITYPHRSTLELWIQILTDEDNTFKLSLPSIDEGWYQCMMDVVQRCEYSYSERELHLRAAELFYNTNKAHNFIDGNKRSSILIVYLFHIINDYEITSRLNIRDLAKKLAKSHGRTQHDVWIKKIRKCFEENTVKLARS